MAIDKADWHSGGTYPPDLPPENGGTHIGVFLAWVVLNGLEGDELKADSAGGLDRLRRREITGRDFLFAECDGKLAFADLAPAVRRFARAYYEASDKYFADYHAAVDADTLPTLYHAADTWANYDRVAARIDRRYAAWKRKREEK